MRFIKLRLVWLSVICCVGQIMCRLYRQLVGNIALVLCMAGEMWSPSKSRQQAGLQLFLFLNLIGKYAWLVVCQQVLQTPSSMFTNTNQLSINVRHKIREGLGAGWGGSSKRGPPFLCRQNPNSASQSAPQIIKIKNTTTHGHEATHWNKYYKILSIWFDHMSWNPVICNSKQLHTKISIRIFLDEFITWW